MHKLELVVWKEQEKGTSVIKIGSENHFLYKTHKTHIKLYLEDLG